ncbi:response regulator [Paenibacillus sp. P26]|nr:response regulator [Paenibacillus sp. P26]
MAAPSFHVLVVEDDFRIAKMHGKLIESQEGYHLAAIAYNYEQALAQILELGPELVLLDVYLPDRSGIESLRTIRSQNLPCDVILITAAKESDIVEEGLRLGVFDYLIKPFDLDHLQNTLHKYTQFKSRLSSHGEVDQQYLNELMKLRAPKSATAQPLQKGIDERTLVRIKQVLEAREEMQTADDIAQAAGVSLSTVRNYLRFMVKEKMVEEYMQYGTIGRPRGCTGW